MNRTSGILGLFLAFFVGLGVSGGQVQTQSDADSTTTAALHTAIDKLVKAKGSKTRFTYFHFNHLRNINEKGKATVDVTRLFEVTYIGDLQYSRLMEMNGKPLTGKSLRNEQERYDEAVRDHSALDEKAWAKIEHREMKNFDVNLNDLAQQPKSIVGHEVMDGRDCVLIDSAPLPTAPQKRYRIWFDPVNQEMVRLDSTLLADEGDKLSGATFSQSWIYIDDVPLVSHGHIDAVILVGKKRIRVVSDHIYSRFRKFSVTTTIIPVEPEGKP